MLNLGTVNGLPIIAGRPTDDYEAVVVVDRGVAVHDRYVVWRIFRRADDSVIAYAGYYTPDQGKALANMEARA